MGCMVQILPGMPSILTGFMWYVSLPSDRAMIVTQVRPRLLPFAFFPFHYLVAMMSDVMQCGLPTCYV